MPRKNKDDLRAFAKRAHQAAAATKLARFNCGLIKQIADAHGVTSQSASRWFKGEAMPSAHQHQPLARQLEVNVAWLFYGEGPMKAAD